VAATPSSGGKWSDGAGWYVVAEGDVRRCGLGWDQAGPDLGQEGPDLGQAGLGGAAPASPLCWL
jgi:hypothetical protein